MGIFSRFFKRKAVLSAPPKPPVSPEKTRPVQKVEKPANGGGEKAPPVDTLTPEERCEITPEMSEDEIRQVLAKLFRRHNRLASSMEPESRNEAEYMLDLIVQMREKYLA